ncbi:MAG TPA: helix-turn-helix domain-containing protein [Ktedonobacteraceae bacterium]|nr:helix-turn-helix domain-containing protein [Ktedonobacteraceae bacterium]
MLRNIDTNREHLTTPEAAERSGLTRTYLALLLRRGRVEGFRHGRDWFVYTDSLEAFLASPRKSGPRGPRKPPSETHTNDADRQSQGNDPPPDF